MAEGGSRRSRTRQLAALAATLAAVTAMVLPVPPARAAAGDVGAWAWGRNDVGQLGTGDEVTSLVPTEAAAIIADAEALAAGDNHTLALLPDGTVWAWGAGGLLGVTPVQDRATPVQVSGLSDVTAIAAGPQHSLAVTEDGTVWAWGSNSGGQLTGDDSISFSATPIEVMSVNPTGDVDLAVAAGQYHSLALDSHGNVLVWGDVEYDALGQEHPPPEITTPVEVEVYDVVAIASGAFHSFAVKSDGTLWAWGDNVFGQRGTTGADKQVPAQVPGFDEVTAIAAHTHKSLALEADGDVWTWGQDGYGPLREHDIPVRVSEVYIATAIAAGGGHSLVLTHEGDVLAWGANNDGQLGDGTTQYREAPVQVSGLDDVTAIAAGRQYSLAVGVGSPDDGVERVSDDVLAGATVTSDSEGDGATPEDPLETTITSPNAGTVSIEEPPTIDGEGDFSFVGRVAIISAPVASAADPLVIGFRIDESVYPDDWDLQWFTVNRNGVLVEDCTAPTAAVPDPCVESLTRLGDGDVEVVVRTSAASTWLVGRPGPSVDAGGPYTVAEGSRVVLNGSASGEAPAFKWSGGGTALDNDTKARPTFTAVDDAVVDLDLLVTDAIGLTGSDDTTVTVTNRPPLVSPFVATDRGSRRVSILGAFTDPGRLDTHTARVRWGDGTESAATVIELRGTGAVLAEHRYAGKATYTVTVVVRDDDGAERSVERRVVVR